MMRRFRHPKLGEFHKFVVAKNNIWTTLISDAELARLVKFLSDSNQNHEAKKMVRIVDNMLALEKIEPPVWGVTEKERAFSRGPNALPMTVVRNGRSFPHPKLKKISPEKYQQQLDIDEKRSLVTTELARHQYVPIVFLGPRPRWNVMWRVRAEAAGRLRGNRRSSELNDGAALQMILDLARAGYLNRLRRCVYCEKWLYAKFRHQMFCSRKCQQKHYAHSEEWRAKRREYMRGYRQGGM